MSDPTIVRLEWSDVRDRFTRALRERNWPSQPALSRSLVHRMTVLGPSEVSPFVGCSREQILGYLECGYAVPLADTVLQDFVPRRRKRARWSDEDGDPDASRLLGGADEFYLTRGISDTRPGLKIEVQMVFSADVPASLVTEYGAWVAALVAALEAQGCDLEVSIISPDGGLFHGQRRHTVTIPEIIVKRPNEVSDFTSWSALFAPGGFRTLIFTALGMCGDKLGRACAANLGHPTANPAWRITQDGSTIRIGCDSSGRTAPAASLTEQAKTLGLL